VFSEHWSSMETKYQETRYSTLIWNISCFLWWWWTLMHKPKIWSERSKTSVADLLSTLFIYQTLNIEQRDISLTAAPATLNTHELSTVFEILWWFISCAFQRWQTYHKRRNLLRESKPKGTILYKQDISVHWFHWAQYQTQWRALRKTSINIWIG